MNSPSQIGPLKNFLFVATAMWLGACSHSAISPDARDPAYPGEWQRGGDEGAPPTEWLQEFGNTELSALVGEAIVSNYGLRQQRARVAQAEQSVVLSRANRFPTLNLSLDARRRKTGTPGVGPAESFDKAIATRWDVDLWGRLNEQQQSSQLSYAAQLASLESAERNLAASTARTFFQLLEAQQLLGVAKRRLDNVLESQDIVERGYRQGLNDALDLYLAKNQVERQKASYEQQRQTMIESSADLQLLLARYPDGKFSTTEELPLLSEPVPAGLPSELLVRRPDVQQAWLSLLAADADLAAAHKARFPSLSLVASTGTTSTEFSELLDIDNRAWSVTSGLTQPLFNGGRLRALESQAFSEVERVEQQYLELVYSAFADVENAISRTASIYARYQAFLEAEKNSAAALSLALQQYQRGLVSYTTVLESQRQAFDAETTVVQLKSQLIQNRINLYLALGGEYSIDN